MSTAGEGQTKKKRAREDDVDAKYKEMEDKFARWAAQQVKEAARLAAMQARWDVTRAQLEALVAEWRATPVIPRHRRTNLQIG
jgi:hypothetical protein